ncbi:MAG: sulfatase-like hydrolase/transferase [Planctomycetota bacterium]|jgi:hypothetical protein
MNIKATPVLHPILFAIFPVIFLYAKNMNEIYFHQILLPLVLVLGGTLTAWFALNIFYKSWHKSGIVISCMVLFMFSYGNIAKKLISGFNLDTDTHAPPLVLAWLTLLGIALLGVFKIKQALLQWTKILNLIALCLILLNGMNILTVILQSDTSSDNETILTIEDAPDIASDTSNLPNIFYLIFDAHLGSSGLRQFGYDNSWFVDALEERGVFVAKESYSNYMKTPMCLASSLNYAYLDNVSEKVSQTERELTDLKKLYPLLDSNRAFRFLKKLGYQTIHCPTDALFYTHQIKSADLVINENKGIWNGVSLELARNTPFFENRWFVTNLHRNRILGALQEIKALKEHPKPFILFAHILSPHFPAVFDRDGGYPKQPPQISKSPKIEKYLRQMEFIDKQILDIIDLLQDDENPPVIILQGDHGLRSLIIDEPRVTDPRSAQIGFSILNAYYLPGNDTSQLYDSISPVNTFPVIFNHYFGTDLEIVPDRSFFCSKKSLYDFQDVTSFLEKKPPADSDN